MMVVSGIVITESNFITHVEVVISQYIIDLRQCVFKRLVHHDTGISSGQGKVCNISCKCRHRSSVNILCSITFE